MKKKELGITEGEVKIDRKRGWIETADGRLICECTHCNYQSDANLVFIADAFNTASKCGLLPSELLQWKHETLMLLKEIANDTERRYRFTSGSNWPKWYDKAINQIEQ